MLLRHLWACDFRSYEQVDLELPEGLTAVVGRNGAGKSNLLEAVSYLGSAESFRGAQSESMIRAGAKTAVLRGEFDSSGRALLVETEIGSGRANRTQLNRQRISRTRDLLEVLAVTVFAPEDLELMKGAPAVRRDAVDTAIVSVDPAADGPRRDLAKILRQRNALLRQAGGRMTDDVAITLDVWDQRLATVGEEWAARRRSLVSSLSDSMAFSYTELASRTCDVSVEYTPSWSGDLGDRLAQGRQDDLRRGVTLIGPHRDDIRFTLNGLPARTHASQGEQRTLSLALRLSIHRLVAEARRDTPLLLLDDVFSELDPSRSAALLAALPPGQALLTTAGALPDGARPELVVTVDGPQL